MVDVTLDAPDGAEIVSADFEFEGGLDRGEPPQPLCGCWKSLRTGREVKLWRDQLRGLSRPPFSTGPETILLAYAANAELANYRVPGWPAPHRVLDLHAEFRAVVNDGVKKPKGYHSLLGALSYYGEAGSDAGLKDAMRDRILQGEPFTRKEKQDILRYCMSDVTATIRLFEKMAPNLKWPQALLRGSSLIPIAAMEVAGIPIDTDLWSRLVLVWEPLKRRLIEVVDQDFHVFEGTTFKRSRFFEMIQKRGIPYWPIDPDTGKPTLDTEIFAEQCKIYSWLRPLYELRQALSDLRLTGLTIGSDGHNRTALFPFSTLTGRNAPSNTKFIFGPAKWMRGLMRPPPGHVLVYVDWVAQEIAIAAALSEDPVMIADYSTGDLYIAFAIRAGRVPPGSTKETHLEERERCKVATGLGANYGLGASGLARRLRILTAEARELLDLHRRTYPQFWRWVQAVIDTAEVDERIVSEFGWPLRVTSRTKPNTLRNFKMQAAGGDMLRIALVAAAERGLPIVAPIHDAILLCSPTDKAEEHTAILRECMKLAGLAVTRGIVEVLTEAEFHSVRYADPRGTDMWAIVMKLLVELEQEPAVMAVA
jgi:hypothetical protein